MNGTVVNDHSLEINNTNHTCQVLCLNSGQEAGYQGGAANTNLRAIGQPIFGIGKRGFTGLSWNRFRLLSFSYN